MESRRWELIQRLFREATALPPEERKAFVEEASPDPEICRELLELLEADASPGLLLESTLGELAAAVADPQADTPTLEGREVGPYRVIRRIGAGGMGTVYLAERQDVDKLVALKLVRGAMAASDLRARFLQERRLLARLEHPNIARLLDAGVTEDDTPYFAMEYVEGVPITRHCEERELHLRDRLRLFLQVCEAVRYAHARLVVHRDLKPGNILVTEAGVPKLLDFGIAKLMAEDEGAGLTGTGVHLMSPEYAAPEQFTGEPVTAATDVYALGVLLCEILTGERPYRVEGGSFLELADSVLSATPRPPSTILRTRRGETGEGPRRREIGFEGIFGRWISADLDAICLRTLEREPDRRYGSAEELHRDVESFLEGRPVEARLPTLAYRARKFVRRNWLPLAAAALVILSLTGGLGAALWQAREADRAREEAEAALARTETVTDFFMDLFSANDPDQARGEELSARELLDRGIEEARGLEEDPALLAELLERVGEVYNSLGAYAEAEELLVEAVEIKRRTLPAGDPDVVDVLSALGVARALRGDLDGGARAFRTAVDEGSAGRSGEEHPKVLVAMSNLGVVHRQRGDLDAAEAIYRRTLEIQRRLEAEDAGPLIRDDVTATLNNLAVLLHRKGDLEEAEVRFREVLDRQRRFEGEDAPAYAIALSNLALLLEDGARHREAEELLRQAYEIRMKVLEADHPAVGAALHDLGQVKVRLGEIVEADSLLDRALELQRAALGDSHRATLQTLHTRTELLLARGEPEAAAELARQVVADRIELLGETNPDVVKTRLVLARALLEQGRSGEAEGMFEETLAAARASLPSDHPDVGRALVGLGLATPDPARRSDLVAQGVDILSGRLGADHPEVVALCAEVPDRSGCAGPSG